MYLAPRRLTRAREHVVGQRLVADIGRVLQQVLRFLADAHIEAFLTPRSASTRGGAPARDRNPFRTHHAPENSIGCVSVKLGTALTPHPPRPRTGEGEQSFNASEIHPIQFIRDGRRTRAYRRVIPPPSINVQQRAVQNKELSVGAPRDGETRPATGGAGQGREPSPRDRSPSVPRPCRARAAHGSRSVQRPSSTRAAPVQRPCNAVLRRSPVAPAALAAGWGASRVPTTELL